MSTWGARDLSHNHSESLTPDQTVHPIGSRSFYVSIGKPAFDRFVGLVFLAAALLPMAFIALTVRLRIGSPVFFKQERVGRNGHHFTLYKFRTMAPDRRRSDIDFVGQDRRRVHKSENDPRVTTLGAKLRSLSLDELPQFVNVVAGDMSLVGPRPELPEIVEEYEQWQHQRHAVKPGVTGIWQISDRQRLMKDCIDMDVDYVENVRFLMDLRILARTPVAMFTQRGH